MYTILQTSVHCYDWNWLPQDCSQTRQVASDMAPNIKGYGVNASKQKWSISLSSSTECIRNDRTALWVELADCLYRLSQKKVYGSVGGVDYMLQSLDFSLCLTSLKAVAVDSEIHSTNDTTLELSYLSRIVFSGAFCIAWSHKPGHLLSLIASHTVAAYDATKNRKKCITMLDFLFSPQIPFHTSLFSFNDMNKY